MYTYCPGCAAIFRITAETVSAAGGQVHCGKCDRVFNAVDCLYDDAVAARHAALLHTGQALPVPGKEAPPHLAEEIVPDIAATATLHRSLPGEG